MDNNAFTPTGFIKSSSEESQKAFLGHAAGNIIEILHDMLNDPDSKGVKLFPFIKLFLCCIGLALFWTSELMNLFLHRNFTVHRINLIHIIINFLLLFFVGFSCLGILVEGDISPDFGSSSSFLVAGISYLYFSFYFLLKGIKYYRKTRQSKISQSYSGESLLGFIKKMGTPKSRYKIGLNLCS